MDRLLLSWVKDSSTLLRKFSLSYATYITKAIVCGSFEQGTADKSFLLFTREAGMLYATARSVREERSKQRCALQDFSRIRVSLVKGKVGWRVGSVEVEQNDFALAEDREVRASVAIIYRLLRRFIRGEEVHVGLYDFVIEALDELLRPQSNRRLVELFVQVKILFLLGYVDEKVIPKALQTCSVGQVLDFAEEVSMSTLEQIIKHSAEISHL